MLKILVISTTLIIISVIVLIFIKRSGIKKPELECSIKNGSIIHEGKTRTFSYYVPEDLPGNPSLLIALHRARSNGFEFRDMMNYRFEELADKHKFIIVYPDGFEGNWNDCRKAPADSAHKLEINDTDFISTLIDSFIKDYSLDKSRVFAFGFSAGGHMCLKLAASIPDKVSKIAFALTQIPANDNYKCEPLNQSIPALFINGTDDPISPYHGGEVSIMKFIKQGRVLSVDKTIRYFIELNSIKKEPVITAFKSSADRQNIRIEKKIWTENNKYPVHQFIIHGGGHTLPGTDPLPSFIFGKTCEGYVIADDIIDFFLD